MQVKIQFQTVLKKNLGFHAVGRTREDLPIDVSITNVGLISTKPGWFLFSGYGQMDRKTDTVLESSYGNMLIEAWNSSIYREHGSSLW